MNIKIPEGTRIFLANDRKSSFILAKDQNFNDSSFAFKGDGDQLIYKAKIELDLFGSINYLIANFYSIRITPEEINLIEYHKWDMSKFLTGERIQFEGKLLDDFIGIKNYEDLANFVLNEVKTSEKWAEVYKGEFKIMDPDGWDRTNYEFDFKQRLVSRREFLKKVMFSTCTYFNLKRMQQHFDNA